MVTNHKYLIPLVALVVLALNFVWCFVPDAIIRPFYFYRSLEVSTQVYVNTLCKDISYIFISLVCCYLSIRLKESFFIVALMLACYTVDYMLSANRLPIPLSYSFYMALCLLAWMIYEVMEARKKV